jgi:hypothetical protein
VPKRAVVPVLQGALCGRRWIVGSSTHGCWLGTYERENQRQFASPRQALLKCNPGAERREIRNVTEDPPSSRLWENTLSLSGMGHSCLVATAMFGSNTHEITIYKLAHLMKKVTGSNSEILHLSYDLAYKKGFKICCIVFRKSTEYSN